jgi:methionyl-tRNA formyltransferase
MRRALGAAQGARRVRAACGGRRDYSILFFGTDEFSLPTLQRLHEAHRSGERAPSSASPLVDALEVVCPADRPAGRGHVTTRMPVKEFAAAHGLRTHEVPYGV